MPAIPPAPVGNVGSQLDRAIRAFLISMGCGGVDNINTGYSTTVNTYPNAVVKSIQSTHAPENTGVEVYTVQIQARQSAVTEVGEPNPEGKRVELDGFIGQILAAMMQTSDGFTFDATAALITTAGQGLATSDGSPAGDLSAQNNADMAEFTLDHLYYKGATRGQPDDESAAWIEVRNFECHAYASSAH